MAKASKKKKKVSPDQLAEKALKGEDITGHFSKFERKQPDKEVQRVNVDFTLPMLSELDSIAQQLNISRQAVIKSILRQGLDQHYLAKDAKNKVS